MIGPGAMGRPIAVNRLGAGHSVIVYSRTRTRGDELRSLGAEVADSAGPTCSREWSSRSWGMIQARENVASNPQSSSPRSRQPAFTSPQARSP